MCLFSWQNQIQHIIVFRTVIKAIIDPTWPEKRFKVMTILGNSQQCAVTPSHFMNQPIFLVIRLSLNDISEVSFDSYFQMDL